MRKNCFRSHETEKEDRREENSVLNFLLNDGNLIPWHLVLQFTVEVCGNSLENQKKSFQFSNVENILHWKG
jgi:hypothetical protein